MQPQQRYQIKIEICSEAIFTDGEKENNLVHRKAQTDEYGFVFFHAKTLKGQLKRQAFWLLKHYAAIDKEKAYAFYHSIVQLFGINKEEVENIRNLCGLEYRGKGQVSGLMKLSNLELDERLRNYFIYQLKEDMENGYFRLSPHDLVEAQTHIRTGIQLQEGVAKDKMLNTYHTVREGLIFYSSILFEKGLEEVNLTPLLYDLARIVYSFNRIGAGIHRGRGKIKSDLLIDDEPFKYEDLISAGRDLNGTL